MSEKIKVDSLKKIALRITVGKTPEAVDLTGGQVPFEFIFGTGVNGITPFEYELANKLPGEMFQFNVRSQDFHLFFDHLALPMRHIIGPSDQDLYLQGYVEQVSIPTNREIIKAMAGTSGCDDGCCGDGCCGH